MKLEDRRSYLTKLLTDACKTRSIYMKGIGNDEASITVAAELEPWLFDKKQCIIPALNKCLSGEPSNEDIMNFSRIAKGSAQLSAIAILSKRHDPEFNEIFKEGEGKCMI